jgi:hypothetical protein
MLNGLCVLDERWGSGHSPWRSRALGRGSQYAIRYVTPEQARRRIRITRCLLFRGRSGCKPAPNLDRGPSCATSDGAGTPKEAAVDPPAYLFFVHIGEAAGCARYRRHRLINARLQYGLLSMNLAYPVYTHSHYPLCSPV